MQTEKNIWMRMLSMILTLALLISCIPNQVYAMVGDALADLMEQEETAETIETPNETRRGVYEVTELREANVKHFALEDGTYTAVMYGSAVHTQDAEGNWQDIDNRLSDSGSEFSTSNARIKFAKKITGSENLFTLHDGNRKITMSLNNAIKKTTGAVTNHTTEFDSETTQLQKLMTLDSLSSEILYADILDGVDLQYVVESLNVKENIIVKERKDSYQYKFTIALNNLKAEMAEDGSVRIYDPSTKETVYNIPAGFMYDANGEYSTAVVYTLTNGGNGRYSLTVTADAAWINEEGRTFPVTIDPSLVISDESVFQTAVIHPQTPNTNGNNGSCLSAGNHGIAYAKTTALPTLPDNAYIIHGGFYICKHSSHDSASNGSTNLNLGIYQVTSAWNPSTFCYNVYDDGMYGKILTTASDSQQGMNDQGQYRFDITDILKAWYRHPEQNFGVAIKSVSATSNSADLCFWFTLGGARHVPLSIIYRLNGDGLEDYWSYSSQNALMAGAGYVNNASGALSFSIGTLTSPDGLFSFTPTLVYNTSWAGKYFKATDIDVPYDKELVGKGFKMNMFETLRKELYYDADSNYVSCLVWNDADGTPHYFYPEDQNGTTIYKDADGLHITIVEDGDYYVMTDQNFTVRRFLKGTNSLIHVHPGAVLETIQDCAGNKLQYVLSDNAKVTEINLIPYNQEPIELFRFVYCSDGLLCYINNSIAQQEVYLYYSETNDPATASVTSKGYLSRIEHCYAGETVAELQYSYDESGRLICAYDVTSNRKLHYVYDGNVVVETYETNAAGTQGQKISFDYAVGYTEVRTSGTDDVHGNDDDIINAYIFDEQLRITSCYSMNTSRSKIYGAATGEYETMEAANNSIKTASVLDGTVSSYIANGGFESGLGGWYPSVGFEVRDAVFSEFGHQSAFTELQGNSEYSLYQYVHLPKGEFTFSMNIQGFAPLYVQAYIVAESMDNSSHVFTKEIPISDYSAYDNFTIASTDICVSDADGETFRVGLYIRTGAIYERSYNFVVVDNVALESDLGCSNYNMVEFGNFENYCKTSDGVNLLNYRNFWLTPSAITTVNVGSFAQNVLTIGPNLSNRAYQIVYSATSEEREAYNNSSVSAGYAKTFVVSGMAKGTYQVASGIFRLEVVISYMDSDEEVKYVEFQNDSTEWQFAAKTIITKDTAPISRIIVRISYNNPGVAYFDNIYMSQVADENTVSYEYHENGLVKSKTTGTYAEEYEYDAVGNLIRETNNRGELYKYTYDYRNFPETVYYFVNYDENDESTEYPQNAQSATEYTYNAFNLLSGISVYDRNIPDPWTNDYGRVPYMQTTYSYDVTSGSVTYGMVTQQTDTSGAKTKYFYNDKNGRLEAVIDGESNKGVCYTYDKLGNITSVLPAEYSYTTQEVTAVDSAQHVEYTYDSMHRLSTITTDSTVYRFTYDDFGNTESFSTGTHERVRYVYNPNNGKLSEIQYSNKKTTSYVYDELDNISQVLYNGEVAFQYTYNAAGLLYRFENVLTGNSIEYHYDANNRLIGFVEYDGDDPTSPYTSTIFYDDKGRVSGQNHHLLYLLRSDYVGSSIKYSYQYDDAGQLERYNIDYAGKAAYIDYMIDDFGRLKSQTNHLGDTFVQTVYYGYDNPQVTSVRQYTKIHTVTSQINTSEDTSYRYFYDSNDNIIKITYNNTTEVRYEYDDIGQLVREDNELLGKTYMFTYDKAGNITSKKIYQITEADETPTILIEDCAYGYNKDGWGDVLTNYKDMGSSFDGICNPRSYYNGTYWYFGWQNGRRLSGASGNGYTLSFEYNDEGIRTSKTVNGVKHTYRLNGSQIVSESWDDNLLIYLYEAEGLPIGMMYRNSTYPSDVFETFWFERNLQGDIVAVYDEAGTKLISYAYDAWGYFETEYHNGCTTSSVANYNPFLYRGYYYDFELEMYYLQSRYYDPSVGRFISSDGLAYLGADGTPLSYNLFAYCGNNPVMCYDPSGCISSRDVFHVAAVVTIAALVVAAIIASGGTAAPPLLAAIGGVAGTSVTAAATTTVAINVAITSTVVMGVALAATIHEATNNKPFSNRENRYKGNNTYEKNGERIDYEYNGNGTGNVHYQGKHGKEIIWRLKNGKGELQPVSKAVSRFISNPAVQKAVGRAIDIVLSLAGMK